MSILYLLKETGHKLSHPCLPLLPGHPRNLPSPGVEATAMAGTALPVAAVPSILLRFDMVVVDVVHQVLQELKELVALWDQGMVSARAEVPTPALTTLPSPISPWPSDTPAA